MKKKIFNSIIFSVFITFLFISCNDLDLSPISSYNAGSFYETENDFKFAVNGAYSSMQGLYSMVLPSLEEGRSDNVSALQLGRERDGAAWVSAFIDGSSTPFSADIWRSCWSQIARCNAILDKIDAAEFNDETMRSKRKGEAYFLRGNAYFDLGRMYGGVPLMDHQLTFIEMSRNPRSTQDETLEFAANDLLSASQLLPESWPAADMGRATKYAAQGILAKLYMFQNKFSLAKPLLESIIQSGKYQMAVKYEDCFLEKYDNSPEHVFQVQYAGGGLNENNYLVIYIVPEGIKEDLFPMGGVQGIYVSHDLYESYEPGDLRRDFTLLNGWHDKSAVLHEEILFIKYAHQPQPASKGDYGVNLPILRYTDVRLMYAEILNEEGYNPNGEAFSILNAVRSRAGLSSLTSVEIPSKEAFRDAILHERRVEFAGEYLRWFDLIRTGRAMDVMNTFLKQPREGNGKYKMQEHHKLYAIPQYELDINPDRKIMWQNPGY